YEYDPNDYLKVREFLLRRQNPEFKKTQRDDLFSMETGLLQFKGHVNFTFTPCINDKLQQVADKTNRAEVIHAACSAIDSAIHSNYKVYPINYIAFDRLNHTDRFAAYYTDGDVFKADEYIDSQLAKIDDVPSLTTSDDMSYMREMMLTMYANPLRNQLKI
ncbi:MAG: acyltransferase, partial [Muribaculaceae bacterium]|nr:acyltransferase [Muribaculaceae bacterium]